MRDYSIDFLKVTEEAAIAAYPWIGSGEKLAADQAATNAMREHLNRIDFDGKIVIGEGELDEAPMLYINEEVGSGQGDQLDIAVDPIEGTTPTVNAEPNAFAVIAAAPRGTMLHAPDIYMEKMVVGPQAAGNIDIDAPLADNLQAIAKAEGKRVQDLQIAVQKRDRHHKIIEIAREYGAKVQLFNDGDITYAIATCLDNHTIDLFVGTGGAPEGVVAAVAVKCLGGDMQARLLPQTDEEIKRCKKMGILSPKKALRHEDLIDAKQCVFSATGITENILLQAIKVNANQMCTTHSLLLNSDQHKVHYITSDHLKKTTNDPLKEEIIL
ncbi:fructose 1,6-bisphosphatase II [Gracilibacillus halophilus YIM-C55.5]|uniref:Fructose-1,6-bisphosphatase n=1 Tax=Gracilibacillus halophilus YIM-C55.5 TaxID=1308866 RepID=N4WRR4_9BACI|nr:class II fructose-bisphosphatase [Gracilibacillus halophilus]ENH95896.1 fructose 1,6-bisphosphatase II [Gracilibacillus halophilus YIM-C55.5]